MIKSVLQFHEVPPSHTGLADVSGFDSLKYYSFFVLASPWADVPGGGIASIVPLTSAASSIPNLNLNYPVASGGEAAAYELAVSSLKAIPVLATCEFHEQK